MKITPELIPHTEFHKGIWLLSVERPEWYYFMRKKNSNLVKDKNFLRSVDKPLRRLVKFLHKRGIKTTPSCSGHHISERNLGKIYTALEKDADEIRNGGLEMKDVETGQRYFFKDKRYVLPWTRQDFLEKVSEYQQKGVIGLRLGNRKRVKALILNSRMGGVTIEEKDSIVFILTNENNKGDNREIWMQITKMIMRELNGSRSESKLKTYIADLIPMRVLPI